MSVTKPAMRLPAMVTTEGATGAAVGEIRANRWTMKEGGKEITAFHSAVKLDAKTALKMGVPAGTRLVVSLGVPLKTLDDHPNKAELVVMARTNYSELEAYRATARANGIPEDVMAEARAILAKRTQAAGGAINKPKA